MHGSRGGARFPIGGCSFHCPGRLNHPQDVQVSL